MDACLSYLSQVSLLMEDYDDTVTPYQALFEAEGSAISPTVAKNTEIEGKTEGLFQKAVNSIKAIIDRVKEILGNILKFFKMDQKEYDEFRKFEEACKKDPNLANKKVTYKDYSECYAEYFKLLDKCDKEYRGLKDDAEAKKPRILKDLQDGMSAIGKKVAKVAAGTAKTVTLASLIRYAKSSRENAQRLQEFIEIDSMTLGVLDKEVKGLQKLKFKAQVNALNSRFEIVRNKAGAENKVALTLKESFSETLKSLKETIGDSSITRGVAIIGTSAAKEIGIRNGIKAAKTAHNISKNAVHMEYNKRNAVKEEINDLKNAKSDIQDLAARQRRKKMEKQMRRQDKE